VIPNYWPTAQQELWLQAALLPGEAGLAAWRRAAASLEPDRLDDASQSLLPLVYSNLARLGARDTRIDALKQRYLLTWSENQRLYHGVLPLLQRFEQARIDAVVLKGLALIARFYRDPGARPMADVDVLVPPSDAERARDLALALGWRPRYRLTPAFFRVKHAAPFEHRLGIVCDIHWRVFEDAGIAGADDDFRAATEPVVFQGSRLRVLCPTDQLLHACGHAARWAPVPAIRWVADCVLILREGPVDWPRFLVLTEQRRLVLRMRKMLGYLRDALDVDIPRSVDTELTRRPVSMLERLEYRIRSREHRLLGELPAYVFNCFRGEPHPLRALPGYLRDAWGLGSLAEVPRHALMLAGRRVRAAMSHSRRRPRTARSESGGPR
jgi:Uncharacterised nucleotidyltransferase